MKLSRLFGIAILALGLTMASCSIEDGKDGINGIDGVDGQDGINGADGQDGADGQEGPPGQDGQDGNDGQNGAAGLEGMIQYGAVTLDLSGTRPDGIPFEDSAIFRFTPIDADDFDTYNIVTITPNGDDTEYSFSFRRFYSSPDGTYNINFIQWELTVLNPGQETQNVQSVIVTINNYGVVGDDNKYFMVDDIYESGGLGVSEMVFTDMAFDPNDGNHLTFSYAFTVDGANNSSNNELSVSGIVDINLLEQIPQ